MAVVKPLNHNTGRDHQRAGDDASASTQGRGQEDELWDEPADQRRGKPGGERGSGAMTLIEHLQELRRRLLISVAAVGVGSVVGFLFWDRVLGFLLSPLPYLSTQIYKNGQLILLDADSFFSFVAYFLLAFSLVFELPLVLTFMAVVGLISTRVLRAKRIYILFGLWFLSNFITPGADRPLQPGHHRRRPHRARRAHHPLMRAIGK